MRLILASGSPRRRDLLTQLGVPFEVLESGIEEEVPPHSSPERIVEVLARQKAEAVSRLHPDAVVLGADTTIDLDGRVLGKPADPADARRMLRELRGRPHRVLTGLAMTSPAEHLSSRSSVVTTVLMRAYSDDEIRHYVETGEPLDKAGAYAIQELGGRLVDRIDGCYCNVVGLPLCEAASLLVRAGWSLESQDPVCRLPDGSSCPRLSEPG